MELSEIAGGRRGKKLIPEAFTHMQTQVLCPAPSPWILRSCLHNVKAF